MQDYLLRKGREVYSRLGAFVRKTLPVYLIFAGHCVTKAQTTESDFSFNEGVRYSQWVINSRINDFYANTTKVGLAVYDKSGNQAVGRVDGKKTLDYVPGLVAKGIIEASQYYSQFNWAGSWAKPWYLSVEDYGNKFYDGVATGGGSLDDLNAVKLYIPLREMSATNGYYPNNTTYSNTKTALDKAITGLNAHNSLCRINTGTIAESAGYDVTGGWWHKKDYNNQMWLDGQYMGAALLAQLVNYNNSYTNVDGSSDWDLATKQLDIVWNMCWNPTDKLLYHAFDANAGTNSVSNSDTWQGISATNPYCFHSSTYWARACGWYFLALVDILEEMNKARIPDSDARFTRIKGYLGKLSDGLKDRQDNVTGGWYQILDEDGTYSASTYNNGKSHIKTYNYVESSATAIFAAAYLKAIRLGYIDKNTYEETAKKAYQCLINQFFATDGSEGVHLFGSCRSAGLGGKGTNYEIGKERFRDGSKEYYLLGYDVAKVAKSEKVTEGKVLGAFILAATEYERLYQKDSEILFTKDLAPSYDLTSGTTSTISIEAAGSGTPAYQWYKEDGTKVEGATTATFCPEESGTYYCEATSGNTTIRSSSTKVTATEKVEGDTEVDNPSSSTSNYFSLNVTTTSGYKLEAEGTLNLSSAYADIQGGTASAYNGKSSEVSIIASVNKKGHIVLTGSSKVYIKIILDKAISVGDIIKITTEQPDASFYITSSSTRKEDNLITDQYTITNSNTTLVGKKELYLWNNKNGKFNSINIGSPKTDPSKTNYSYRVKTNYKTPALNTSRYIKDVNNGDKILVNMTFGGWKHNGGSYNMEGSGDVTDAWEPATKSNTDIDGFNTYFLGKNAAHDEMKGTFTENSPFTLPVRGAFMTMEPTKSGKLTAYVMHNGDFYITNQRGDVLKNTTTGTGDVTKYEFDVIPNETYYLFSNTSAMAFCGASFIPDKTQQTVTAELSETTKYNATNEATGYASITLNRSLNAGQWNTLTLPFNMTENEVKTVFGEGTQIIILEKAEISGDAANLHFRYHEIQNILAGYPYLIKPTKAVTSFALNNKYIDPSIVQNDIDCGSYTAKGTPGYSTANVENATGTAGYSVNYKNGDIFLSDGNGKLYISQGTSYGKGYRSYIEKKDGTPAAKSIAMSYTGVEDNNEHGGTTSIGFTELSRDTLSEIGLGGVYNLNGQRISETTNGLPKGIYIVNGQKMIVK